jgi:hypothetical protein
MSQNAKELLKSLEVCKNVGITPLIVGRHGIGKSQIVYQYAESIGASVVEIRAGQLADAGEIVGLAEFLRDGETGQIISTKFFKPHFLPTSGKVVLFIDEINRGSKDILQALFQIVYDRKISLNGYELGPEMSIVAAMNPDTSDYDLLSFDDSAFNDRFLQIKFEPTVKEWATYMRKGKGYDSSYIDFILESPEMLNSKVEAFDLKVSPSPRSGEFLMRLEQYCEKNNVSDKLFFDLGAGVIGLTAMAAYKKFKTNSVKNLKPLDILNNFKENQEYIKGIADLNTGKPEVLGKYSSDLNEYVLAEFKANRGITEDQWDSFLDYYNEMSREHIIAFFKNFIIELGEEANFSTKFDKYFSQNARMNKLSDKLRKKTAKKEENNG